MQRGDNRNKNPQNQIIIYKTDDGKSNSLFLLVSHHITGHIGPISLIF